MLDLAAELRQCEADTAQFINRSAANRLSNWRQYATDTRELVAFIKRAIRGPQSDNGWILNRSGGRSLERIVIDAGDPTFTQDDIRLAKETLGE